MKRTILLSAVLLLALSLSGCANAPPNDAEAARVQAQFDSACQYARGVVGVAKPLLPVIDAKIGRDLRLAIRTLFATVDTTCVTKLDVNNSADVTQRIYDAAGEVLAIVVKAQST